MAGSHGRPAAVLAALWLAACASAGGAGEEHLVGPEWVLSDISGMRPLHGSSLTLTLAPDGQVSGSGGCNRFVGRWTTGQRGRLTLSGLGSTMMACEAALMEQEQAYLKALEGTSRVEATAERLVLDTHDGRAFTFARASSQ